MAWYDHGIAGKNGDMMLYASGGVTQPITGFYNLSGGRTVGSAAITEQEQHDTLLCTTASGTQIFLRVKRYTTPNVQYYLPTELKTQANYYSCIYLKKGTSELFFGEDTYSFASVIAGENNIYDANIRLYPNGPWVDHKVVSPNVCYPVSARSGGGTQQIAMTVDATGIKFWEVGFSCVTTANIEFSQPCRMIGKIAASALENAFWFDQGEDGISDEDFYNNTGGIPGGGYPVDFSYPGTDIDFPGLPSGASALGFGKMHIFHPTSAQLGSALDILWSDTDETTLETIVESCKKWWYKPEQYCVSLMLMPVDISGTNQNIYFGKYDTGVSAPAIASQWQMIDCGSVTVPLKSNTAFDFSPYVKAMLFLPYIGFRAINVNECMGGTISVKYYVDMFTGSALCFVKVGNPYSNTSVLYTYECNIAQQVPINSENYSNIITSLIHASVSLGSVAISPGVGAGIAAAGVAASASQGLGNPDVQTSGQLSSNTGALGAEYPYVVLHFPVQSMPSGFIYQNGYPSDVNVQLSAISGYTEVAKIHLDISGATQEELNEIESLLKAGVIL